VPAVRLSWAALCFPRATMRRWHDTAALWGAQGALQFGNSLPIDMKLPALDSIRRDPPQRLREIKKMVLFGDLSYREARVLDGFLHERAFLPGEVIFDEGEQGEAFYLVLEGEVLICRQGQVERPIAVLPSGSFFGELALLDDAPRSAQARAATQCVLLVLFRGDFLGLMQSHGWIASKIAMQLARHLGMRLRANARGTSSELL
jgi:CRP/FNR family cyclic AMP-dependent transcriptional regulator